MSIEEIFTLQFVLSLIVFLGIGRWLVYPWLTTLSGTMALTILLLPHTFRHIGMSFLVPNLNAGGLPENFAIAAAYGDLASAVLAIIAILSLRFGTWIGYSMVWLFNVVGTVDLVNALRHAEVINLFGATWFIPTFIVPMLLVSHLLIFFILTKPEGRKVNMSAVGE